MRKSPEAHGMSKSALYRIWINMLQRCYNPAADAYPNYGARGIYVCDRWRNSFRAFFDDKSPRPPGTSLERIDNDGPYSPENCRWEIRANQMRNKRSNRLLTFNGKTLTLVEWAERIGITGEAVAARLKAGWSIEVALTKPASDTRASSRQQSQARRA
jgi:hypothetical protein